MLTFRASFHLAFGEGSALWIWVWERERHAVLHSGGEEDDKSGA